MGERSLISVVVPAWRAEKKRLPPRSIPSLSQTWRELEVLVVDDASPDGTLALAQSYAAKEPRVRVIAQPENGGVSKARNRGVREARGEWIAFLDSDDLWMPESSSARWRSRRSTRKRASFSRARRSFLKTITIRLHALRAGARELPPAARAECYFLLVGSRPPGADGEIPHGERRHPRGFRRLAEDPPRRAMGLRRKRAAARLPRVALRPNPAISSRPRA